VSLPSLGSIASLPFGGLVDRFAPGRGASSFAGQPIGTPGRTRFATAAPHLLPGTARRCRAALMRAAGVCSPSGRRILPASASHLRCVVQHAASQDQPEKPSVETAAKKAQSPPPRTVGAPLVGALVGEGGLRAVGAATSVDGHRPSAGRYRLAGRAPFGSRGSRKASLPKRDGTWKLGGSASVGDHASNSSGRPRSIR